MAQTLLEYAPSITSQSTLYANVSPKTTLREPPNTSDTPAQDEWKKWGEEFSDCLEVEEQKADNWLQLSNILRRYDKQKVHDCKEDIDTLLVFAGLYSAILSAFIIEAYHLLQSNSPDQSVQVLLQISKQLNSFSINSPFINSTQPFQTPSTMQFEPAPSSVVVNALWFCSLVCSLVTASLGILVKQWLREYISMDCIAAKECCRVRLFRRRGLVKYRVFEIAAFLPLLLQLSLILFFMGLILFILPFHKGICWTVTSLVMIWVIFYVSTTLAPAFSPSCPYKTPFLKTVLHDMRSFLRPLLRRIYEPFGRVPPKEEVFVRSDASMDETILLDADITFKDSDVFETVRRCLAEHQQSLQLDHTFRQLIERRIGRPIESIDHRDLRSLTESEMSGMALTLAQHLKASLRRCYDLQVYQPWNGFIEDAFTLMELMTHRTPGSTFGRLFEAFILIPVAPLERALFAFGDSAVKWMSERRYQPTFPRSMNVSAELMEQIILGAETILQTKEEGIECILVWGVVCDFAYAMSDHEFVALGDTMHRRIATILTTSVEKTVQFPVNPDFDLAVKCHGILDESVIVSRRVPGIIRNDSLGALDTLCLELFRAYVEAEGFYLTNWEKLIQEPVSPGDVYSGITWWEVPRQGNKTMVNPNNADWRVRWLRESYTERRSFLVQIRNTQTSTLCKGGIIRRASV